jgi:class 3 adenylate cyclase/DNA-binding response OmpR family regulator
MNKPYSDRDFARRVLAGETILVVDDGRENREFIVEYVLEPNGYQAMTARDGREGLTLALQHQPDLILLDLQMPHLDGIGVLEHLVSAKADIPVILMTFHGSEDIAIEVFRLGVRDYLKKPFTVEEMLAAIDRSLTIVRLRKEKEALTERVMQFNRELQQSIHEMNVLYGVGKSVTGTLNMDELLPRIVDAAVLLTHAETGQLYLCEENQIISRATRRRSDEAARPVRQAVNDRIAQQVIQNARPILLTPDQLPAGREMPRSVAYVPLTFGGDVIGALGVATFSQDGHVFTRHDGALLSALTDYAAIAIENSGNFEALRAAKERENALIRGAFERFVPPSVVNRVLDDPNQLALGGRRQEISVLFADIRGFTSWSENAPPEQVVEMLNDYLSMAAEVVLAWDGTLDKFMGDGLMALFNAPVQQNDHVHRAADAALALLRASREMSEQRGDGLAYSVGVHVGEAVVGYVGTERAINYTAVGDVVNLAKRLQEYAAPGQVLIERAAIDRLGDLADAQPLGEMSVRGRRQPAFVYELRGLRPIV